MYIYCIWCLSSFISRNKHNKNKCDIICLAEALLAEAETEKTPIQSTDEYLDFEESREIQECSMGLKFNRNKLSLQSSYMRGNKFSNPQRTWSWGRIWVKN